MEKQWINCFWEERINNKEENENCDNLEIWKYGKYGGISKYDNEMANK